MAHNFKYDKIEQSTAQMMSLARLHMLPAQPATTFKDVASAVCRCAIRPKWKASSHTPLVSPPYDLTSRQIFHVKSIVISRRRRHQHGFIPPCQRRQSFVFHVRRPSQTPNRSDHAHRIALHDLSTRIRTPAPVPHITRTRTSAEEYAKPNTI
jgi:hypothetical protein